MASEYSVLTKRESYSLSCRVGCAYGCRVPSREMHDMNKYSSMDENPQRSNYRCHPRAIWYPFRLIASPSPSLLSHLLETWSIHPGSPSRSLTLPLSISSSLALPSPRRSHRLRHSHCSFCPGSSPDQSFPGLSRTSEGVIETHKNTFNAKTNGDARERTLCVECGRHQMYKARDGEEKNTRADQK